MQLLLGLVLVVSITLLASSRKWWAYRRYPLLAALTAGGWITVLLGMFLGPQSLRVLGESDSRLLTPLIFFGLGWAGMMVGLQADLKLRRFIPAEAISLAFFDLILTTLTVGALSALVFIFAYGMPMSAGLFMLSITIAVLLLGCTAEIRSLRLIRKDITHDELKLLQISSGLSSIAMVVLFGISLKSLSLISKAEAENFLFATFAYNLFLMLIVILAAAMLGRWLMVMIGRKEPEFLVLLFGLVALCSGTAVALGYSPLFACMLCGVLLANFSHKKLVRLKRFVLEAERPIALGLLFLAGMWAYPFLSKADIVLVLVLLVAKLLSKLIFPKMLPSRILPEVLGREAKRAGYFRQSPLALILCLDFLFSYGDGPGSEKVMGIIAPDSLLFVLILTGVSSHLILQFYRRFEGKSSGT